MPTRRAVSAVRGEERTSSACDAHAPSLRYLADVEIRLPADAPAALSPLDFFAPMELNSYIIPATCRTQLYHIQDA
jgi:hypothetical protein